MYSCTSSLPPQEAPATAPKLVGGQVDSPVEIRGVLSQYLGLPIARFDEPGIEGTACLYLRLKDSGKVVALTCRHVVFSSHATALDPDFKHIEGKPRRTMVQPGDDTLTRHKHSVSWKLNYIPRWIQDLESRTGPEAIIRDNIQRLQNDIPPFERTKRDLGELDDLATRIFGHVLYAPQFGLGTTDTNGTWLRDWALIELHPGKYATPLDKLYNQVFVEQSQRSRGEMLDAFGYDKVKGTRLPIFDEASNTAWLRGTMPLSGRRANPASLVAKYGSQTGFTVGLASHIKSVIRHVIAGNEFLSEEWCIISRKDCRDGRRACFSGGGDSGSCVFGDVGRIGGMLIGRAGYNGVSDTSYATPIEWLLDDIKEHGYDFEIPTIM